MVLDGILVVIEGLVALGRSPGEKRGSRDPLGGSIVLMR